ncbi:ferrous iron transport protein A [Candidatus Bathyarchaeota archaeon]|nr:MAG: ferrous iron transport protein A [Candidatus Bathyarchaeota archaeon ex4484_40]RJS78935.1 MAG: ferrous iron transport protein A [Candidatus Bathyarchaeota archaeon]RLG97700.1 MAG: ferrous iron transport protein A [Candidatus Bathyarchaeota archaeon]
MKIPLAMLSENEEARVIEVRGGRGLVRRLSELGFTPGARVKVLFSNSPGPVLIDVRGSRIALGRGLLMRIIVDPEVNS